MRYSVLERSPVTSGTQYLRVYVVGRHALLGCCCFFGFFVFSPLCGLSAKTSVRSERFVHLASGTMVFIILLLYWIYIPLLRANVQSALQKCQDRFKVS